MKNSEKRPFPKWLFAIIATCGLLASGIFIGIMSGNGISPKLMIQAAGFGLLGVLMLWGAVSKH